MENTQLLGPLRAAAIGLVSGIKGGSLAGAIGGAILMLASVSDVALGSYRLYILVLALTTGGMAGALLGALYGIASGALSGLSHGRLLQRLIWLGLAMLGGGSIATAAWASNRPMAALIGAACGLLGGLVSERDFVRLVAMQAADRTAAEEEIRP